MPSEPLGRPPMCQGSRVREKGERHGQDEVGEKQKTGPWRCRIGSRQSSRPPERDKKSKEEASPPTPPTGGPWGGSPQACWRGASPLLCPARPRARRLMLVHHAMLWEEQTRGQRVPTKWIRVQHYFLGNHRAHYTRLHSCVGGSRAPSAALPAPDTGRSAARQWSGARPSRACSRAGKFDSTLCRSRSLSLRRPEPSEMQGRECLHRGLTSSTRLQSPAVHSTLSSNTILTRLDVRSAGASLVVGDRAAQTSYEYQIKSTPNLQLRTRKGFCVFFSIGRGTSPL